MAARKNLAGLMTAAALAAVGGCKVVSDPPKSSVVQDVEFLRGCWVAKAAPNGPVTGFLRLLPEEADGLAYQGYLQLISGNEGRTPMHLSFARDGSSMTMRDTRGGPVMPMDREGGVARPHAPLPDAIAAGLQKVEHRASYAVYAGQPQTPWMVAEGDGDRLAIYTLGSNGQGMGDLFGGERDGCD
jgi:hypothetical protein